MIRIEFESWFIAVYFDGSTIYSVAKKFPSDTKSLYTFAPELWPIKPTVQIVTS